MLLKTIEFARLCFYSTGVYVAIICDKGSGMKHYIFIGLCLSGMMVDAGKKPEWNPHFTKAKSISSNDLSKNDYPVYVPKKPKQLIDKRLALSHITHVMIDALHASSEQERQAQLEQERYWDELRLKAAARLAMYRSVKPRMTTKRQDGESCDPSSENGNS